MDRGGVQRIVRCCSGLQKLDLVGVMIQDGFFADDEGEEGAQGADVPRNVDLTPLLELPCLTSLAVAGVNDSMSSNVLAQLTGLERLSIYHWSVSKAGIQALTTLQELSCLHFLGGGLYIDPLVLLFGKFQQEEAGGRGWFLKSKV